MKNYKYKLSHTIIIIIVYLILVYLAFIYAITSNVIRTKILAIVILPISLIYGVYLQIKIDRMFNVYIDEEKLIASVCRGWVSEETKILLEDITIIKCYRKYIIIKKVEICTKYKCLRLNIRNFKNYKEMLQTIINKTKNNKRVKIDDTIYTMVK